MNPDPAKQGNLAFLCADLKTGTALASIAETATDPDKINRNWKNAGKACLSLRHYIGKTNLSGDESAELYGGWKS